MGFQVPYDAWMWSATHGGVGAWVKIKAPESGNPETECYAFNAAGVAVEINGRPNPEGGNPVEWRYIRNAANDGWWALDYRTQPGVTGTVVNTHQWGYGGSSGPYEINNMELGPSFVGREFWMVVQKYTAAGEPDPGLDVFSNPDFAPVAEWQVSGGDWYHYTCQLFHLNAAEAALYWDGLTVGVGPTWNAPGVAYRRVINLFAVDPKGLTYNHAASEFIVRDDVVEGEVIPLTDNQDEAGFTIDFSSVVQEYSTLTQVFDPAGFHGTFWVGSEQNSPYNSSYWRFTDVGPVASLPYTVTLDIAAPDNETTWCFAKIRYD